LAIRLTSEWKLYYPRSRIPANQLGKLRIHNEGLENKKWTLIFTNDGKLTVVRPARSEAGCRRAIVVKVEDDRLDEMLGVVQESILCKPGCRWMRFVSFLNFK
jgi:hypothetical protein